MTKEQRVEKVILGIWDSLQSHLPYTYEKSAEGKAFHKRCVIDYAKMIVLEAEHLL